MSLDTDPADHETAPKKRRAGLGVVYFTVFLDLLGFGIILPFLPFFAIELGASGTGLGALLTAYSLAQLVGAPILGRLSDRFGRRPVLIASLLGASAAMVFSGLAQTLVTLCLARALAGLFGGSISTAQAYIADVTEPGERAKFMGILGAAIGFGFVLGPALGVALDLLGLGFPGAAFTAAGLAAANAVAAFVRLEESRPESARTTSRPPLGAWLRGLTKPGLWQALAATFLTTFAFVSMETTFALYGQERFGLDPRGFGLVLVFVGMVMIVVQGGLIGRLTGRFGVRPVAVAGGLLMGAALAGLPFMPSLVGAALALGVLAIGQGLSVPTHATLVSHAASHTEQGSTLGARQSFAAAARAIGPILAGPLYDFQAAAPYFTSGALAVVAGLLLLTFRTSS